jgi:hypothetical protein
MKRSAMKRSAMKRSAIKPSGAMKPSGAAGPGRRRRELDWDRFVDRRWERAPARLPARLGGPPIRPDDAFRAAAAACAPFRAGTRFRALPDVRFFAGDAQIRAPGALLPGPRDRAVDDYHRRIARQLGGERFQLFIDQPLVVDFPLWAGVRDWITDLVARVGVPVLPIACDLAIGNAARTPRGLARRPHHAVLALVLRGRVRVRLWERLWGDPPNELVDFDRHEGEAVTLEAAAGDVLYWPARFWHIEQHVGRAADASMLLRLWIPTRGARSTDVVKEVLADLLDGALDQDGAVPFLPFPPRGEAPAAPLARAAAGLAELSRAPALARALRVVWARRVSACGLEPVPAAREAARPLDLSDLVRADPRGRPVRMPAGGGEWIWAVNGHAFALAGQRVAARVLRRLDGGGPVPVADLCRAEGGGWSAGARALVDELHRLRAIDVVDPGAGRTAVSTSADRSGARNAARRVGRGG